MTIFDNLANANPVFRSIADALNKQQNVFGQLPIIGQLFNGMHGHPNSTPMQPPPTMQPPTMFPGIDRLMAKFQGGPQGQGTPMLPGVDRFMAKLQQPPLGGIFGSSPMQPTMQPPTMQPPRRNIGLGGY